MGILKDKWNKGSFSIYKSEEKTALKLFEKLNNFIGELSQEVDNKTDLNGNHMGSWQGLNRPTLSEEGMRATVEKLNNDMENEVKPITMKVNNIKTINVLDYGIKNDGVTDNTLLINDLILQGYKNLHFPKGTYLLSIDCISNMTITGDGKNETLLKQVGGSNKNVINIIDGVSFIDIKNLTINGNDNNNLGHGVFIKGSSSELYCNYIFLENVDIKYIKEDGFHCEGYNVENKLTNCIITSCGKRNYYSEGHDTFLVNVKCQRSGYENFVIKGNNVNATNIHSIYANMLQKDMNKNSEELRYSMVINGSRASYSNIDCQDCYGHGVLIENCRDVNLSNFLVDAVGINRGEEEWWVPNAPNNCYGFNIKNSNVNANSVNVTNWHQNEQGASYILNGDSQLRGEITRNNLYVKAPIINSNEIYGLSFEQKLFDGMKEVLNKSSINWGYSLIHSNTPVYELGRYGNGVKLVGVGEHLKIDTTSMNNNNDFELSFTYTPKSEWDNVNTRWLLYSDYANGNILECLLSGDGKLIIRYYDNKKYYTVNYDEVLTNGFPYRIFIKITGNKMLTRVYKYNVLMGEYSNILDTIPTSGNTVLYFGNNKTPQVWWSCNGIIEDIHISKCIPSDYDYKETDTRIKVTPLTLFKANLNGTLN